MDDLLESNLCLPAEEIYTLHCQYLLNEQLTAATEAARLVWNPQVRTARVHDHGEVLRRCAQTDLGEVEHLQSENNTALMRMSSCTHVLVVGLGLVAW